MGSEEENAVRYASADEADEGAHEKDTESAAQSVCSARFRFQSPSPSFIYGYTHVHTYVNLAAACAPRVNKRSIHVHEQNPH